MSYQHVPHRRAMESRRIHQYLDPVAKQRPETEALVVYEMNKKRTTLTYKEFSERSAFLASSLLELGVSRGDRVLMVAATSIPFAVSILACCRIGANIILLGPGDFNLDKAIVMKTLNLKMIVIDPAIKKDQMEQLRRSITELTADSDANSNPLMLSLQDEESSRQACGINRRVYIYHDLIERGKRGDLQNLAAAQKEVEMEDPLLGVFTSGSTGPPKCVQHTSDFIYCNLVSLPSPVLFDDSKTNILKEKMLVCFPMSWEWGTGTLLQCCMGLQQVWTPAEWAASQDLNDACFEIIEQEKASYAAFGVAIVTKLVQAQPQLKYDLSSLKLFVIGGQRFPLNLIASALTCLPDAMMRLQYGSSETGDILAALYNKENLTEENYGKLYVYPGTEVKIVDEHDKIVPRGTPGEVCFRSQGVYTAFLITPDPRAKSPSRWFRSSDVGIMDKKGRIEILGRRQELIFRGGVKITPSSIERVLVKHDSVIDAIAVGVPDQQLLHQVCACVILREEEHEKSVETRLKELEEWCVWNYWPAKADGISLVPKYFLSMEKFPLRKTGKVDRKRLRETAMMTLGIKDN